MILTAVHLWLLLDYTPDVGHNEIIRRHYIDLVDHMDTKYDIILISHLLADHVITDREKEEIETETNQFRRNERLLSLLSKKSAKEFELFVKALEKSGQERVSRVLRGKH